jgi:hypothetical protein
MVSSILETFETPTSRICKGAHLAYNHTWNTLGALLRSQKEKQIDGSWDRTFEAPKDS